MHSVAIYEIMHQNNPPRKLFSPIYAQSVNFIKCIMHTLLLIRWERAGGGRADEGGEGLEEGGEGNGQKHLLRRAGGTRGSQLPIGGG